MSPQKRGGRRRSLTLQAYELLKEKMISMELAPGTKLEEQDLMDRLDLGRTPIREALKMLLAEGLVVSDGTNATYVEEMTLKSVRDLRHIIQSIGAVAFDLANPNEDFGELIEELESLHGMMDEAITKDDYLAYANINADFHRTLAKVASNDFLDHALERIYFFETRHAYALSLEGDKAGFYETVQRHHWEFIDHLRAKDFERMKQVYIEHMAAARERLTTYLAGDSS